MIAPGLPLWEQRRGELATYFDRTAVDAWARLTSDAPVGRIRATVRAGRARMRALLLGWLPADLSGRRVLDAGCGTGAASVELARRGARVVAVDLSPTLLDLARERLPADIAGRIEFVAGDMLTAVEGRFDHALAMDSLIHYPKPAMVDAIAQLARRVDGSLVLTFAPRTAALSLMHAAGRAFPRGDRAPAIEPVRPDVLFAAIGTDPVLAGWRRARSERISAAFYTSQALELVPR